MTKILSMVSRNNYNLGANEAFDFQVNYLLYWRLHSKKEFPINRLFTQ